MGSNCGQQSAKQLRSLIHCRAATVSASRFIRTKKATVLQQSLVRIKGLEPPRLSASDPKSDVATNYTISAWLGGAKI